MVVRWTHRGSHEQDARAAGVKGKLGLSLFFLVFFAMGSLFEVLTVREFARAIGQRAWKQVPCTIVSSEVQERNDDEEPYAFVVSYRYEHDGQTLAGSAYKRSYSGSGNYSDAQRLVREYPAGASTVCYVNPADPSEVLLRRDSLLVGFVLLFPLVFVIIGGGGLCVIWRKQPPEAARPMAVTALRDEHIKSKGKYALAGLFLLFAALGGGLLYPLGIKPVAKTLDARGWVATPCKVLRAEVRSHEGDDSTTYSVYILYEYEFDGQPYKNDRYDFMGGSSSGYHGKAQVVDRYHADANPVCYVDPANPAEAILKRGFHAKLLLALVPLPFLLIGLGGLMGMLRGKKRADPATNLSRAGAARKAPGSLVSPVALGRSGPLNLKARHSPRVRLIGAIVFALFWNGILSIFLVQAVEGFRHGHPDWFQTLSLIPFVLVGVGLVGLVVYQFLALFNPRPTLELSAGRVPLGGAAALSWQFSGQTGRIRALAVTLRGVEEARYRKGTSTYTDHSTFYEMELYRTESPSEMGSGQVGFVIPAETMHSFEAENNKIRWSLELHGDIKCWPDVKESFPIEVVPATSTAGATL
ncbi:MAG: DUF3592 domain-containing protein [Sedimentisphaerales bacterium]|nr:DUF3592 domain-containing protein [Sedimentisphaerales bacterium]